jgi:hypothetical protein
MEEKVLIKKDKGVHQRISQDANRKLKALNDAVQYVEQFTQVETADDRKEVAQSPQRYIIKRLRERFADFSDLLTDEKILEFAQVNIGTLRGLQIALHKSPQIAFTDDYTKVIIPDVSIYATTPEELRRLEISQRLIDVVNEIRKEGFTIDFNNVQRALSNAIESTGASLTHHAQFIKKR